MSETQIAIASLVIGAVFSGVIAWYFFRKSVSKRLSAYIQFASPVLSRVDDPEVRKALEISYRGTKIDDLLQVQFVIANEGQRAIRDLIEPLAVTIPKPAKLLEATILHVEPKGRQVSIGSTDLPDGQSRVDIKFKLLNKGEFFFVKMLINGKLDVDALRFRIAVDDLPPVIAPERQPFRTSEEEPTTGVGAVLLGLVPLALSVGTAFGILELRSARLDLFPGHEQFSWISWSTFALLLWVAGIAYWFTRGVQLVVTRGLFGRKHRFRLPRSPEAGGQPRFYGGGLPEDIYAREDIYLARSLRDVPPLERDRLLREIRLARTLSRNLYD
jgi:hypothetical protein